MAVSAYLESIWVLVAGPSARLRVEEKARLVLFTDVVVKILSNSELTMQLIPTVSGLRLLVSRHVFSPAREKYRSSQGKGNRRRGSQS
jgi:hypothetical protein